MNGLLLALMARPVLVERAGRLLAHFALIMGLFGAVGHVLKTILNAANSIHAVQPQAVTLASLYPSLPTGWIPEGVAGAVCWAAVFVVGMCLRDVGRTFRRLV